MTHSANNLTSLTDWLNVCRRYPMRWLGPAAVVIVFAGVYALARHNTWEATQALFVRNEATNRWDSPGKFRHDDEMKITQETILDVALSRAVLSAALETVGPPANHSSQGTWPSVRDVEALRDAVKLTPPKGAEFGSTEVFYLKVKDRNRGRAVALTSAICDALTHHLQKLREAKAQSMMGELRQSVELATGDLDKSTARLSRLESQVGSDLAELRILHQSPADSSDLRRQVIEMESELRSGRVALAVNDRLLKLLDAAQHDSGHLLATPSRLLDSLPALRRLKDGLVDAQLRTSQLLGSMSLDHPRVRAAKIAEEEIRQHIHSELAVAIRGLEVDRDMNQQRVASLERQLEAARGRLGRLAGLRARYSNLVATVEQQTKILEDARRNFAEARASQAGAGTASLVGRVEGPVIGSQPVGPGRNTIALAGVISGLAIGLGVLFLTVPANELRGDVVAVEPVHNGYTDRAEQQVAAVQPATATVLSLKEALRRVGTSAATVR